jgi:hypothetical protein
VSVCFRLVRLFRGVIQFPEHALLAHRTDGMADGRKPRIKGIADLFTEAAPAPGANDFQIQ